MALAFFALVPAIRLERAALAKQRTDRGLN